MAKRAIIWTLTASRQRRKILKYWNNRNKSTKYSKKIITFTKVRLIHVSGNPLIGKITDSPNTRVVTLGHFNIYYQFNKEEIIITNFWDNRQNPKKLNDLMT